MVGDPMQLSASYVYGMQGVTAEGALGNRIYAARKFSYGSDYGFNITIPDTLATGKKTFDNIISFQTSSWAYFGFYEILEHCRYSKKGLWMVRERVIWTSLSLQLSWNEWGSYLSGTAQDTVSHYAFEVDASTATAKVFLDGEHVATAYTGPNWIHVNPYAGGYCISQFAVRDGHFSSGTAFPVPQEPYNPRMAIDLDI